MISDRGISFHTTTSDGKEYVAVFGDPNSSAPTYTYILDKNKKEISMTDKIELITAIEENRLSSFIANELKQKSVFSAYGFEVIKVDDNQFKIVQSIKSQWHYNDVVIALGTMEDCALLLTEKIIPKTKLAFE